MLAKNRPNIRKRGLPKGKPLDFRNSILDHLEEAKHQATRGPKTRYPAPPKSSFNFVWAVQQGGASVQRGFDGGIDVADRMRHMGRAVRKLLGE